MCKNYTENENTIWCVMDSALKSVLEFYQGDGIGFLEVDVERNLLTSSYWYNPSPVDNVMHLLQQFESSKLFDRWSNAMCANSVINIPDIEIIKAKCPNEYEVYQRLFCRSLLAIPVKPQPSGFFVIRNPKRHITDNSKLQFLVSVFLNIVNEKKRVRELKMDLAQKA